LAAVSNPTSGVAATLTYNSTSQIKTIGYGTAGNTRGLSYDGLHRLTADELKTPAGASVAKIAYGYDPNGNETSKTTTGFAGAAANTYSYDLADRLTSWNNGSATTVYAYDKSGNRVQAGVRTFGYDQRNQLTSGSDGTTYQYTARGTLSRTNTSAGALTTTADAFGQVASQAYTTTSAQTYSYDALGRVIRSGFAYTGLGNDLASDGSATYTRDTGNDLLGVASGSTLTQAWTDQHDDVVGQFTATGSALAGSTAYDPLGQVLAGSGMLGHLGYQSEWTDTLTNRVNMAARWYNTDTGQFDTRDTVANNPVPDSVNANEFAYADDNPLTVTDPTGQWGFGSLFKKVTSAVSSTWSSASSYVSSAYSYASSYASYAYSYASSYASSAYHAVTSTVQKAAHAVSKAYHRVKSAASRAYHSAKRWVSNKISQGRKWVSHKVHQLKQKAKQAYNKIKQAGKKAIAKATRVITKVANKVQDAYNASEKWVKDHKNAIIEIAAIGVGILAGLACTAATAGAGAVACMVGAAALINVAKDAAEGNIHNLGDLAMSAGTGAATGLLGAGAGAIGGKVAGAVVGRLGAAAGSLGGRMLSGGVSGAVADSATQLATTGHVDPSQVAMSAGIGAAFGGFYKGTCHSFDPNTKVAMADGTTRPIKDINVGDKVKSTDPTTGKTDAKPVILLHQNHDTDLADVTVSTATADRSVAKNGNAGVGKLAKAAAALATAAALVSTPAVLHTTAHHPFWDQTTQSWANAADLKPGTSTLVTPDGSTQTVTAVRTYAGAKDMRDLTIAQVHTYYVVAASTPVLVHNCSAEAPKPSMMARAGAAVKSGWGSLKDKTLWHAIKINNGLEESEDAGEIADATVSGVPDAIEAAGGSIPTKPWLGTAARYGIMAVNVLRKYLRNPDG
jgi:RHS repeat-associated protein